MNPAIGQRLRSFRYAKSFSQGEVEKRAGLLRCYISRVENGHTVPSIQTLERWARALDVPPHEIFCEQGEAPELSDRRKRTRNAKSIANASLRDARFLNKLRDQVSRIKDRDRRLFLQLAHKMAGR